MMKTEEKEYQGEEWLAEALLADMGDEDIPSSNLQVLCDLTDLFSKAESSPLTQEIKDNLMAQAREISKDYPHDLENFAYDLDCMNSDLQPASLLRIGNRQK